MSSSNHWISLFIEHCLSSYEAGRDPGSDWEDDGSNIRFSSSDQRLARITEWGEVNDVPRPRLSDLDTQIEAVLSGGSLQEYNREYPNRPLSRDRCLGYTIQLDDFELVYEYFAGKPNVHLYVKRFNIVWARDKAKEPPRGKLVAKKPALITLLKRVLSSIKSRHKPSQPNQETANTVDSNGQSENGDILANGHTQHVQHQLMSQLPCPPHQRAPNQSPIRDAAPSGKLLESLGQIRPSKDRQPSREMSVDAQPSQPVHAPEAVRHRSTSYMSADNAHYGPHEKQRAAAAGDSGTPTNVSSEPLATQIINHPSPGKSATQTPPPIAEQQSPKRAVERSKSPDSPERQLQSRSRSCGDVTPLPVSHDGNAKSNIADPWEGMTGISSADVTVPDDQKKLLESDPTPWYPPPAGYQVVSKNVPLALLAEWDELAFRQNQIGDNRPEPVDDDHPAASSPADNESSSDYSIPWSASPERTLSRSMLVLPKDSSPLRDYSVSPQRSRSSREHDNLADKTDLQMQTSENSVPELDGNTRSTFNAPLVANTGPDAEAIAPDTAHDDGGHVSEGSRSVSELANDDSSSGSEMNNAPDVEAIAQGPADGGHESYGSSDSYDPEMNDAPNVEVINPDADPGDVHESDTSSDSEMSVAIPQPLSGSTQQETSTQEEVPSSGLSLPEPARQNVQVVETPAVLSKSGPALSGQDASKTELAGNQSQPKSSSQSRILSTYASHEGESKGGTSQESSRSVPATAPDPLNRVHVMGTPFTSQAPPTQPTPWSASNSIYTSSGPNVVEGSVPAASIYHSQSSKAFSSYREMRPSSMLSIDDSVSPSIQSSVRGTPLRPDRASPLKRFASEFDSDRCSPSKRSKLDHKPTAVKAEGGLDENIIARHQNYIINSAHSVEAAGIYEKFRGDYPNYAGDYEHFINLCSRLQSFRDRGSLQRSFLWDDFIIKHLETYPCYLAECHYNHTKPLEYEEYFAETFSKPTYKRRNLDIPRISACAAQVVTIIDPVETREPNDAKTSFTANLREQLSNLHTHSLRVKDPSSQDRRWEDDQSEAESESVSQYSIPDSEPARAAARERGDGDMNIDHSQETDNLLPVWEDSDEDMEDAGIDVDVDDTVHETASVELGDDETRTVFSTPVRSRSRAEPLPDSLVSDRDNEPTPVSMSKRNKLATHPTPEKPVPNVASEEISDASVVENNELVPVPRNKSLTDHPASNAASDTASDLVSDAGLDSEVPNSNKGNKPAPGSTPKQSKLPAGLAVEIPAPGTESNISTKDMNEPVIEEGNPASNAVGDPNIQEQHIDPAAGPSPIRTKTSAHPSPGKHTSTSASSAAVANRGNGNDTTDIPEIEEDTVSVSPEAKADQQEEPEEESKNETENENWFTSLRHIFPTSTGRKPVWSDDPHTPFKKWARADQNVLLVRNQRGGLNVPVDERGVIGRIPRQTDTETETSKRA
ncbi:hypothetical protein BDW68DRAFT_175202 [Aspergillus falconensis]